MSTPPSDDPPPGEPRAHPPGDPSSRPEGSPQPREPAERSERHRAEPELTESTPAAEAAEAVEIAIEESEDGEGGRLRRYTAVAIVIVSILAAVMAWRSSVASDAAGTDEQLAEQNLLQQQELEAADEGAVVHDVHLFDRYEEHVDLAVQLERASRGAAVAAGAALAVRAQQERDLAQAEQQQFEGPLPSTRADGTVAYDAAYARSQLRLRDVDLLNLEPPTQLREHADTEHAKATHLTGLAVLFVGALVLLTFAELSRRPVARVVAPAGAAVAVAALVLYPII